MQDAELATAFWRNHARGLYDEIRSAQAQKLRPLQDLLASRNYQELEGSLIPADTIDSPKADSEAYLAKRLNYVLLLNQLRCESILEIGFNWGYSASLIMESASICYLHSVDIATHWYTKPAGELITKIYPGRFSFAWGSSVDVLPNLVKEGASYDAISIDGGHDYWTVTSDILSSVKMLKDGGLLIVDDTDAPSVSAAVLATIEGRFEFAELGPLNFGVFDFGKSETACFQQRYFLKRFSR